jgi:hypothetical protein
VVVRPHHIGAIFFHRSNNPRYLRIKGAMKREGQSRRLGALSITSGLSRRSQLIDATLYLRGKRWSVVWSGDFIEGLRRQKRQNYGSVGSVGSH